MATELGSRLQARARPLTKFWSKINEDWVLNFSGMLAYNYLIATAPLALVALAIAGMALGSISPATFEAYVRALAEHLPAGGERLVAGALKSLSASAGVLLVIAIAAAIFAGSRLFIALESCFAVIYRVRNRALPRQNAMAIGMTLLYALLAPLAFIASGQISGLLSALHLAKATSGNVFTYLEGLIAGVIISFLLFFIMYMFVPNRGQSLRRDWRGAWRGALAAAALLMLYEQLFPLYQSLFLRNAGYGSAIGLVIIAVIFLYYVGFITLLGAEVNAWAEGLRPLGATLPDLFRERGKAEEQRESQDAPPSPSAARRQALPPCTPA